MTAVAERHEEAKVQLHANSLVRNCVASSLTGRHVDPITVSANLLLGSTLLRAASAALTPWRWADGTMLRSLAAFFLRRDDPPCPGLTLSGACLPQEDDTPAHAQVVLIDCVGEALYFCRQVLGGDVNAATTSTSGDDPTEDQRDAAGTLMTALLRVAVDPASEQADLLLQCVDRLLRWAPSTALVALADGLVGLLSRVTLVFMEASDNGPNVRLPPAMTSALRVLLSVAEAGDGALAVSQLLAQAKGMPADLGTCLPFVHFYLAKGQLPTQPYAEQRSLHLRVLDTWARLQPRIAVELGKASLRTAEVLLHIARGGPDVTADDQHVASKLISVAAARHP